MTEHVLDEAAIDLDGLPGLVIRPPRPRALLVLAHGAGAGMRHVFMQALAAALAAQQIATVRWEFPYMAAGRKRPDPPAIAEPAVRTAVTAARRAIPRVPLFAGGKSFGGRMTSRAHAAAPLPVRGLVFYGFPLHPPDKPGIERAEHLARAAGPLLFVQGTRDKLAPLPRLRPVLRKLGARATLAVIRGADHGFGGARVIAELAATTRAWIDGVLDS